MLRRWGIAAQVGEDFRCPLPGHLCDHDARLVPMEDGRIMFVHGGGDRVWMLAEVHAFMSAGRVWQLSGAQAMVWLVRLGADLGYCDLPPIGRSLPACEMGPDARVAHDGFLQLLRVRQAAGRLGEVAPIYSRQMIRDWTGLRESPANLGWREVVGVGAVHRVGQASGARRAALWLPVPFTDPRELFEDRPALHLLDGRRAS